MSDDKISLDSSEVTTAISRLRQLGSELSNTAKEALKADGAISKMATSSKDMANMGRALGVAVSAATIAIGYFALKTINSMDALNDLSDASGSSIENLSALQDVAERTGTKFETVEKTLIKFNDQLSKALPESNVSIALKSIGLSAEELKKLDPAEALRVTAVALSNYADDGNKARAVTAIFGESVKEVAPYLKDLGEQSELVATVTRKEAEEAETFNKNIFALQNSTSKFARILLNELLPALNMSARGFTNLYNVAGSFNSTLVNADLMGDYGNGLKDKLKQEEETLAARKKAYANNWATDGMKEDQAKYIKAAEERIRIIKALLSQEQEYAAQSRRGLFGAGADPRILGDTRDKSSYTGAKTTAVDPTKTDSYKEAMAIAKARQAERNKVDEDFRQAQLKELIDSQEEAKRQTKEWDDAVLHYSDSMTKATIAMRSQNQETGIALEVMRRYGSTQEDVSIATINYALAQDQATLAILKAKGVEEADLAMLKARISALKEQKQLATERKMIVDADAAEKRQFSYGWEQAFKKYEDDATNASKTASSVFATASKGMEDAIVEMTMTGKISFSSMANAILADIARMAARKAVMSMFNFMGLSDGGAFETPGVKKFAAGDVFNSPTPFSYSGGLGVLGEAGPESVMPLKRNAQGQLGVIAQGGGGGQVNNITVAVTVQGGKTNDETGNAVANKVAEQFTRGIVKQELMNARRTGGILNPV